MRREPPRRIHPAPPVRCIACGSDAFALGPAHEPETGPAAGRSVAVDLRCGACGHWQRRHLSLAAADRFLDHMALTQATIARALATPAA